MPITNKIIIYIKSREETRTFHLSFTIDADTVAKNVLNNILNAFGDSSTIYTRDLKGNIKNKKEADSERRKYVLYKEGSDDKITMTNDRLFNDFNLFASDVLILEKNEDKVAEEVKKLSTVEQ